ncbi:MAG TPA: ParB/RepB/Spo0J family partition protein [Actinobacteria bacterium]|nr:ParB/RepB/Spo0J family partition protein [Actinomycetota bacterium]
MAAERRSGLGRGLNALIPQGERSDFALIATSDISPNPQQPRTDFDVQALDALKDSIMEIGLLQPIVVRPEGEKYILIAGERRWRASEAAGLSEIPALIRKTDDPADSLTHALVENIQREDLGVLEEAAAFQQLQDDFGMTHSDIGKRVGKSRTTVTNAVRLLGLPAPVQTLLSNGSLSAGHARALAGLEDSGYCEHIAIRAAEEGWTVRQVEDAVRDRTRAPGGREGEVPVVREVRPVAIIELEQRLAEQLGTKVDIKFKNNRGKVTMNFKSLDDLERIYRQFFSQ